VEAAEIAAVLDCTGDLAGKDVLDLGCGDGTYAFEASRRGARAVGVDPSSDALASAGRRARAVGTHARFEVADGGALPFDDQTFDVVIAVTVLCVVENPGRIVSEAARVLRPGGRLVLGELASWSSWALKRRLSRRATWASAHFWTCNELSRLAQEAGLEPGPCRGAVHFPPFALAAAWMAPLDPLLSKLRCPGPAFLALTATRGL
jgi:ubiquinone/menaquinone biosynthesis C-methylase UbiE